MDIFAKIKRVFGSQSALARELGVGTMTISQWKSRGRIPAEWCVPIFEASDEEISLHELRPDLYKKRSTAA